MRFHRFILWPGLAGLVAATVAAAPAAPAPHVPAAGGGVAACHSPADCLARMTLAEKAGQMTQAANYALASKKDDVAKYALGSVLSGGGGGPNGEGGTATEWADMTDDYQSRALNSRLGIPLLYGADAVHGHNNVVGATVFPHHIGMGATRDPGLVKRAEQVTRGEVLGTGVRQAFGPCVCVPRDDRWGRTYEGYGEDPSLVTPLGVASVEGFQGRRVGAGSVLATAKHYVGDGGTTFGTGSGNYLIDQGDTRISEKELRAVHLPPYRAAVKAGVGSVMVSYSSWNGSQMHGEKYLLTDVLKKELGFKGFVISDWDGIKHIPDSESPTYADKVARAVNAGIDLIMVPEDYVQTIDAIVAGVQSGKIPESRVNDAVLRILKQKFALDLFRHPYADRSQLAAVGSAGHRAVAREAVRKSLTLLKNSHRALPLRSKGSYSIVVGGKSADDLGNQTGGWTIGWQGASGEHTQGTTFWEALRKRTAGTGIKTTNVGTDTGGDYQADVGIWVGGETPYAEGVGDSATLAFGDDNAKQLKDICSRVKTCIAILESGRPLIIGDQLPQTDAFVAGWLPGTEGEGITDALFGAGFSGRLPVSWPKSVADEPVNRGDGKGVLFPYGYGIRGY